MYEAWDKKGRPLLQNNTPDIEANEVVEEIPEGVNAMNDQQK